MRWAWSAVHGQWERRGLAVTRKGAVRRAKKAIKRQAGAA
jgi:hypothetical protein